MSKSTNDIQHQKDLYQYWLMEMGDRLDSFIASMPRQLELDYSPESLLRLESWILENYPTVKDIRKESEKLTLDALGRYVGEVYFRNLKVKWAFYLDDPEYVYYGLPSIKLPHEKVPTICPLTEVTASVDRKRGDYIYDLFQKTMKRLNGED
ncbi:hypothetical protein SAMN04487866_12511 [Thermoactinomyces sp. DSM 45891]|uniref:hypothetical protein n=1 Tax=Thermoactinomyces sp. DSM 45891 TaxID=1761907 RepID=UPI000915DF61|nr:hypothetical protein [Thermoactinomyces sp. DSM 45891]SFX78156.1 hypothetical protein SAMN04487866_12511 [Thermoactinomyces sp. DSM 45891]